MLKIIRSIWLGLTLIIAASLLLLYSDRERRQTNRPESSEKRLPRIAIMQWSSTDLLDHTVAGMVDGLKQQGIEDGRTAAFRFFNASGDNASGNVIATDLVSGAYDMILTASTLALQAVAKANVQRQVMHVFGGVTNPYEAGVGITGPEPEQHPRHLVGVGTFQPVERAFRLARQMNPDVKRIGVVWNPGESNSEACLGKAREICGELTIELIEANAGNTSEVPEAIRSILSRGAQAVWVGGDTVAISSLVAIVTAANAAKAPVFTNDPSDVEKGALFGVGASYRAVGVEVGVMAGKILNGTDPATFRVDNFVPEVFKANESVAANFPGWSIPEEVRKLIQTEPTSSATTTKPTAMRSAPNRPWEIRIVRYNEAQFSEDTYRGILEGFKQHGLVEDRDYRARCLNAQGDMTTLSSIITTVCAEQPDVMMTIATPCLQAALKHGGNTPIVFSTVADGVRSGAGVSETDHMSNVTGITTRSPFASMARLIRESVPQVRSVGTLFSPAEINSELYREWFEEALQKEGLKLTAVPVNTTSDTMEATSALLREDIQVIAQISDNTTRPAFPQMIKRAGEAKMPFFCFDSAGMADGALLSLARDYFDAGVEAAGVAVRVLGGESPGDIPFENLKQEVLKVNADLLHEYGIQLSQAWLDKAQGGSGETL